MPTRLKKRLLIEMFWGLMLSLKKQLQRPKIRQQMILMII